MYFYYKMPTDPTKDRLVILVSSGDTTTEHTKRAGKLAADFKSSGRFADVFFSGWLKRGESEKNTELLNDAIYGSTRVILYASPFGKSSYEDFVARGHVAPWKDEFVVGAYSLLRKEGKTMKAKKVYAVFDSEEVGRKEVLCEDFKKKTSGYFDLSKKYDRKIFFTKLIGFRYSIRNENDVPDSEERATLV